MKVNILEELQNRTEVLGDTITEITLSSENTFSSDTVFNLSHRVLSNAEIKSLQKSLDFAPIQKKIKWTGIKEKFWRILSSHENQMTFSEWTYFRL